MRSDSNSVVHRCGQWVSWFFVVIGMVAVISACSIGGYSSTETPVHTQVVQPTTVPLGEINLEKSPLESEDLTLGDTFPADGWRRCDQEHLGKTLAQKSSLVETENAGAVSWQYGAECGAEANVLTIDEYVWIAKNERHASRFAEMMKDSPGLKALEPVSLHQIQRSDFGPVTSTTLEIQLLPELKGFTSAEIVTQYDEAVILIVVTAQLDLIEQDYLDLAESSVKRLQIAQMDLD